MVTQGIEFVNLVIADYSYGKKSKKESETLALLVKQELLPAMSLTFDPLQELEMT